MKKFGVIVLIITALAAAYCATMQAQQGSLIAVNVRALPGIGAR